MDIASLLLEQGAIVDSCSIVSWNKIKGIVYPGEIETIDNFWLQLQDGGTPLFVACQCGHLDVVEGLIERGANPNAYMKVR